MESIILDNKMEENKTTFQMIIKKHNFQKIMKLKRMKHFNQEIATI